MVQLSKAVDWDYLRKANPGQLKATLQRLKEQIQEDLIHARDAIEEAILRTGDGEDSSYIVFDLLMLVSNAASWIKKCKQKLSAEAVVVDLIKKREMQESKTLLDWV